MTLDYVDVRQGGHLYIYNSLGLTRITGDSLGAVHVGDGINAVTVTVGESIEAPTHWAYQSTLTIADSSSFDITQLMFHEGELTGSPASLALTVRWRQTIAGWALLKSKLRCMFIKLPTEF